MQIILFQGGVETQQFFSQEMARAFAEEGLGIFWFDLSEGASGARRLASFCRRHPKERCVALTFNFAGIAGEAGIYGGEYAKGNLWDSLGIPVYNMVVDHPLYYHKYFSLVPRRYTQLSVDRNHIRYMRRFFPEINLGGEDGFVPLGGTAGNVDGHLCPDAPYLPMRERTMDVVFTGNYTPPEHFKDYLAGQEPEYVDFYRRLAEEAIARPDQLIEDIALRHLGEELEQGASEAELRDFMPNLMLVDLCARFYYRRKVIAALADGGIHLHLFGRGWERLHCGHPENLEIHGSVDSRRCLDAIGRARVSLNVMPWFKDGAHDRIFNSMLGGAVCVSDPSRYLREIFTDGEEILFYGLRDLESLAGRVKGLLADEGALDAMAARAYGACVNRHTWAARARQLLRLIQKEAGMDGT